MKDLFGQDTIPESDFKKYKKHIDNKMVQTNARRGAYILWLGVILELALIALFDIPNIVKNGFLFENGIYYLLLHSILFFISLLGLIWSRKIYYKKTHRDFKIIDFNNFTIIMTTLFLISITFINILDQSESSSIGLYIIYLLIIGVIVLMKPMNMFVVMVLTHIVFVFGMILVIEDKAILTSNLINGTSAAFCAWFVSYIFYSNFIQLTYKTIIIEEATVKLEVLSNTDPLTNAYNRRYFYKHLDSDKFKSQAKSRVSFIMFDIDSFKKINDNYGHIVGDEMLVSFSNILKKQCNDSEIIVRWGGEEFIWILLNRTDEEINTLLDNILKECKFIYSKTISRKVGITVSGGISSMEEYDYQDLDRVISITDKALYEAKESGKSKFIFVNEKEKGDK